MPDTSGLYGMAGIRMDGIITSMECLRKTCEEIVICLATRDKYDKMDQ